MNNKKLLIRIITVCFMAAACAGCLSIISGGAGVKAAASVTLTMTGLEIGDNVEIYRIASYHESSSSYEWESAVEDWIQNRSEGNSYKGLRPEQLPQMTGKGSKEFCQKLIVGLKNDSKKIANLDGYSFRINEEKQQYQVENVVSGYYIVLPKGTDRIYELKWVLASADSDSRVNYNPSDGDYQIPAVNSKVKNITADRGVVSGGAFTLEGDEVEVSSTITVPEYPDTYATGKRMLNVTLIVPKGMEYVKDSLELSLTDTSAYSIGEYKKASVYENKSGDVIFFGTGKGYFYEMNGSLLVSAGTEEEALEKYNELHETSYRLKADDAVSEDNNTETNADNNNENNTEKTPLTILNAENDFDELTIQSGLTVFVISLDTEKELQKVSISYHATKNNVAGTTGYYNNIVALSYSVSPLDSGLLYSAVSQAVVSAYSITIVSCEGSGESINMTAEEKLEKSPRFAGVVFALYRLNNTYDGDVTNGSETTDSGATDSETADYESGDSVLLIYDEKEDKTYEYAYVTSLTTDNQGMASISGLEQDDYIIEQKVYPVGYTLSDSSLKISKDAWTDDTVMEGDNDLFVIWLEYETRYLPGTGSLEAFMHYMVGILIAAAALFLIYKNDFIKIPYL